MHFMIDIETMGIRPSSAIVSIGAVAFDDEGKHGNFYSPVSLADSLKNGLTTDESTVKWWAGQSPEIRASWELLDPPLLADALSRLNSFLSTFKGPMVVWGNGVDFDMVVLKSSYNALQADEPWKFYNQRCFRTLKSMFPPQTIVERNRAHDALADADFQTDVLLTICKERGFKLG